MKDKLARVADLIGGGELERDLALQLLREVYAEIKFGAPEIDETDVEPIETTPEEPVVAPEAIAPEEPVVEERGEVEDVPVVAPRRVSPDVIRSLYGADTEEEVETEPEPEPEPQPQPEPEQQPMPIPEPWYEPEPQPEPKPKPKPEPEPQPQPKPEQNGRTILAEAVSDGRRTLGETLKGGERDMATHIAASEQRGLRGSIGLNDRFLMIRDMFDGDAAAFDDAIDRLDGFTDLDEAIVWIRSTFDRSADNRGMQLLVSLVERKLGR